jgi:hypothetical protein
VPAPDEPAGVDLDDLAKVPARRHAEGDPTDGWIDQTPVGDWAPPTRQ